MRFADFQQDSVCVQSVERGDNRFTVEADSGALIAWIAVQEWGDGDLRGACLAVFFPPENFPNGAGQDFRFFGREVLIQDVVVIIRILKWIWNERHELRLMVGMTRKIWGNFAAKHESAWQELARIYCVMRHTKISMGLMLIFAPVKQLFDGGFHFEFL